MINFIQRLAITLLIFSSLGNIASAQITNEAEVESIPTESQTENRTVEKPSSPPAKAKPKPRKGAGKCISNCGFPNAKSYIIKNFDGKERTVRITVTYDKNGKVTDVQINPSTGNLDYDRVIREDAFKLRFYPGKSGTLTYRFNIVGQRSGIFSNAASCILRNFDVKEYAVILVVTYDKKGKVTDVQINPSTGNSTCDRVIREDAFKLRFPPGKSRTIRLRLNIVEQPSDNSGEIKCIRNCNFSNAISYIQRNFDGKERSVKVIVTYDKKGKVTNVQINPSTGNSTYDTEILKDARRLRFSPGKAGTQTLIFNIVKPGSQKYRELDELRREAERRRRRQAEERN